jgi:hypothetical protein
MDPLTLALILGPQAISGIMQYQESSEAREYERQQNAKLENALAQIGIPEARPEYFTPEVYAWLENYDPEVAAYVRERDPRMVEMRSAEAQRAKGAEQQVLQDLLDRSRSGTDVMAEIQRARGMREAAGTMASQAATLQQQLQRQGQQGGLAAYGAALQQQQGAGMQAALAGEQAALAGLQERARAQSEAGTLAGRQLGRELDIERGNVDAINAFNQRLAQSRQAQENLAADIRNRAQQYNIGGRQRIAEKNIGAQAEARNRRMQFEQQKYANQLGKYGRQLSMAYPLTGSRSREAEDYNRMVQGLGDLASTGGQIAAGQIRKPAQPSLEAQQYDLGPAEAPEDEIISGKRYPRSSRGLA